MHAFGVKPPDRPDTKARRLALVMLLAGLGTVAGCGSTGIEASRNAIPRSVPAVPAGTELATARTAFDSGSFGYSAKYYEMAAKSDPASMEACLGMAASYDWLYRFDEADKAYARCSKIASDTFQYHNNMGFSYLLRGDYGKASVSFTRARSIRPADPVVNTNLRILRDAASG
ncbi:hypothetical protein LX81_03350 [Palleronia aestuarii]|uniref:Uncharacterized protein n=1 Tax=Palleronia aestuarii TaxID=568105 RepID=A0A2W7NPB7_9RHOB|nr:hypothetical protein [Palleronia aestuarii]PZX13122.1 hypothetical protein LX81_03350 [Palleronia aestuarii]